MDLFQADLRLPVDEPKPTTLPRDIEPAGEQPNDWCQ